MPQVRCKTKRHLLFVPLTAVDSWVAVLVVGVGLTDCSFQCMRIVPQPNECSTANTHRSMVCATILCWSKEFGKQFSHLPLRFECESSFADAAQAAAGAASPTTRASSDASPPSTSRSCAVWPCRCSATMPR